MWRIRRLNILLVTITTITILIRVSRLLLIGSKYPSCCHHKRINLTLFKGQQLNNINKIIVINLITNSKNHPWFNFPMILFQEEIYNYQRMTKLLIWVIWNYQNLNEKEINKNRRINNKSILSQEFIHRNRYIMKTKIRYLRKNIWSMFW